MAHRWALYLMITTTAAYPAAPLDLPPLGQTGLTDPSMNNNNNNNNNPAVLIQFISSLFLEGIHVIYILSRKIAEDQRIKLNLVIW